MSELWQDVYGSVETWEAERHGTVAEAERERDRMPPHGTEYRYNRFGCRCWDCRQAKSLVRALRKRRP